MEMDGPSKSYMLNKQIISQRKSIPLMFNTENKTKLSEKVMVTTRVGSVRN